MAQPTSLIIFSTIQNIIVVGFAFVLHSSYVQGQSVAGAGSEPQGEQKDQRVGMGGHKENGSLTEHSSQSPCGSCDRHFTPELCFVTYRQYTWYWGNFAPPTSLFEVPCVCSKYDI